MVAWIILSFVCGCVIGYLYFYLRFENKELINSLRKSLDAANRDLSYLRDEYEEFKAQNDFLKKTIQSTLKKNTDLTHVVSELSRYYYHVKVGSQKIQEIAEYFQLPDKSIEEKIISFTGKKQKDIIHNENESDDT